MSAEDRIEGRIVGAIKVAVTFALMLLISAAIAVPFIAAFWLLWALS